MRVKIAVILAGVLLLGGCTTQIKAKNETVVPAKVPFGQYQSFEIKPLRIDHMEGDSGDVAAAHMIEKDLSTCLASVLRSRPDTNGRHLVVEPIISDLKKVDGAERFWLGPMAGSSAVLLNLKFSDATTKEVIADPTFYARAAAMGGAWSIGGTDNAMLTRIVGNACDYTRNNL